MSELDDEFRPFGSYPGYLLMAPCMRDCDHYLEFNGCDNSGCWCKKPNLDRRVSSLKQCASTSCTFADMNTATDVAIMSSIQLQYCVDRGLSPDGMTMPSTALAVPTDSSSASLETGAISTGGLGGGVASGTGAGEATRSRPSGGPVDTGAPTSSAQSTPNTSSSNSTSSTLSTPAKAGIAIGAVFCALLALIALLLLRRRKRNPSHPSTHTPYAPPAYTSAPAPPPPGAPSAGVGGVGAGAGDVSPLSEKTPAAFTQTAPVSKPAHNHNANPSASPVQRKNVPQTLGSVSPPVSSASPAPTEVLGSAPPERHEVHGEAAPGGYAQGGQQQGRWVYEMAGQGGVGRGGAVELGGGALLR